MPTDNAKPGPPPEKASSHNADPSPPTAPVPGAAPAELIKTLLQNTAPVADGSRSSSVPQVRPAQAEESSAGKLQVTNPPPALISALNLAPLVPAVSAGQTADAKPAAPPSSTTGAAQQTARKGNATTVLKETLPVAIATGESVAATAVARNTVVDPQPPVKPAGPVRTSGNEINNPDVPVPNVAAAAPVTSVLPVAADNPRDSQALPQAETGSGRQSASPASGPRT